LTGGICMAYALWVTPVLRESYYETLSISWAESHRKERTPF
jgi:hypothetical protein